MPQREQVLLAAFVALESAHFYSAFLPSVMTIRKFADDEAARQSLRHGEVLASAFALTLGATVGALVDSPLPLLFAAATVVAMLAVYEYAMRTGTMPAWTWGATVLPFVPPAP